MQNLPRQVDPGLVEIGDTIIVRHAADMGVVYTMEGVVADRRVSGAHTHFITKEGGRLFTWRAGTRPRIKVILVKRKAVEQTPMFGMDEIRERIS